jgi:hypothetical protein
MLVLIQVVLLLTSNYPSPDTLCHVFNEQIDRKKELRDMHF